MEYGFADFLTTLCERDRAIARAIAEHIERAHGAYKPCDVRPTDKTAAVWMMNFRKRPKVGKALINMTSGEGRLTVRFSLLTSMLRELFLRRAEFSPKAWRLLGEEVDCELCVRIYKGCQWRQFLHDGEKLVRFHCYGMADFTDIAPEDVAELARVIDIQARHMAQDARDIKGDAYTEINRGVLRDVQTVLLEQWPLRVDDVEPAEYLRKPDRLDKYASLYHLIPMGAGEGLWYYFADECAPGGPLSENAFRCAWVPRGEYVSITMADPIRHSFYRAWNALCEWTLSAERRIAPVDLGRGVRAPCLARFYRAGECEYMTLYAYLG